MRRRIGLISGVMAVLAALGAPAGAAPSAPGDVHVIVVLERESPARLVATDMAERHDGGARRVFDHVLNGFEFVGSADAAAALARAPGVQAVIPDETFALVDVAGTGFFRIDADGAVTDAAGPFRGAGTRVAIIDSGIDMTHQDLAPNLDVANSYNCIQPGAPPQDDNGHGTHVAGIAAAAFNANGYGVVGVAPSARIVALKAFDASGNGTTAQIVCALDHLAAIMAADPMPTALNMSFADTGTDSSCDDGIVTDVLHEALCDAVDAGAANGVRVVPVAAAGNESIDAASTIPAAFHDVVAVSAFADHDGAGGGLVGCDYVMGEFNFECDDTLAAFSNWGASVDVAAPGVDIYSDLPGDFGYLSGTSMAAPHVTGVVALVLGADPGLSGPEVQSLLRQTGECPDGTAAGDDASCEGQGQWQQTANQSIFDPVGTKPDPDGIAEPLVNAQRAARAAADGNTTPVDLPPTVSMTSPAGGATVAGTIDVGGAASDDHGVTQVRVLMDGVLLGTTVPGGDGSWSLPWDTTSTTDGTHTLQAVAVDTIGATTSSETRQVIVDNGVPATAMHVASLTSGATGTKRWTAYATVRIEDQFGQVVPGATVTFSTASGTVGVAAKGGTPGGGGGSAGTLSCVTGTGGSCSVSTKSTAGSVRFTVVTVEKTSATYDPAANTSTEVVVTKP
jgi:subtilisin family serine protease